MFRTVLAGSFLRTHTVLLLATMAVCGNPRPAAARAIVAADFPAPACTSGLPTTEMRTAHIVPPLVAGQMAVRVVNQSPSATIEIQKLGGPALLGPVATKDSWQFDLAAALVAGNQIRVCMTHTMPIFASTCGEWTTVEAAPASLDAPRFVNVAIDAGASALAVGGIHPGAEVVLKVGGVVASRVWAAAANGVSLPLDSSLVAGTVLTVSQEIGAVVSPAATKALTTGPRPLVAPRIQGPLQDEDVSVWVSNVTPGSLVEIVDSASGTVLGSQLMGESIGLVSTSPLSGSVYARATRNGASTSGATVSLSVISKSLLRLESDFNFGVINTTNQEGVPKKGRIYRPLFAATVSPVMFIMHGQEPGNNCDLPGVGGAWNQVGFQGDSYLGYEDLADELAALGFWVFSIAVEPDMMAVADRLELLDAVVDDVLTAGYAGVDFDSPLGFVGHSLGGDTVMIYATTAPLNLDVRAVLGIAPSSWGIVDPGLGLDPPAGVPLLHLMGSEDYFFDNGFASNLRAMHQYDTAWHDKSQVLLRGAGHDCFNACWCLTSNNQGSLEEEDHQEVLRLLAVPFFHGYLEDDPEEWEPYFQTQVRPKGLYRYDLTMQHHAPTDAYLLDNFGDLENEVFLKNYNVNRTLNGRGGLISETNAATGRQEENHAALEVGLGVPYQAEHLDGERVLLIDWDSYSWEYVSKIPLDETLAVDATDLLSFRIMAVAGDAVNDLVGVEGFEQDLLVAVSDGTHEARVRAGAVGAISYPFPDSNGDPVHVFSTVRIPMDAFTAWAPDLDLANVREVKFRSAMRDEGRVLIDDLEFVHD